MAEALILETTFLLDLERELARKAEGPAQSFLQANASASLYISYIIAGELAAGASLSDRVLWEEFLGPFHILELDRETAWEYGQTYRYLSENGLLIGSNDLWIAATALAHGLTLVTRNRRHFARVPRLSLAGYAPADATGSRARQKPRRSR